jgi:branched-chain amino acid transport system substrate-binding protein
MAKDTIHIGVLTALYGSFKEGAKDSIRGVELAIARHEAHIGSKTVHHTVEATAIMPEIAVSAAETLLNDHHVDFIIGPLSGNEGLAIKQYAKEHPETTFINGISAAQDLTLRNPAPNLYNFATNGAQWVAGLAEYVHQDLGYDRVVTVGTDYTFPYAQVGAFILNYRRLGGRVLERYWVAVGTTDFSGIIQDIPADAQSILVALSGADSVHFIEQYAQVRDPLPLLGSSTAFDLGSLITLDPALRSFLDGTVSSGPVANNNPDPLWQNFVTAYQNYFDDAFDYPSMFCWAYYVNTRAALLALEAIDGDLSGGQTRFREALDTLEFDGPCGPVRLGKNRQAISSNFIWQIEHQADGHLAQQLLRTIPEVDPTLGIPEEEYLAVGEFTRDNPPI